MFLSIQINPNPSSVKPPTMKNRHNKNVKKIQDSPLAITTTLSDELLLTDIVEKLATFRSGLQHGHKKVQAGWESIETSSLEAYVSGSIDLSSKTDLMHLPFTTCFLFTCTKTKRGNNTLTWATSLS
jgi:hypothetical protein